MIQETLITEWKDILDLEIAFPNAVFRGQSDASWPLESSILRRLRGTDYEEDPTNTEFWCLREFQRRAHHYIEDVPSKSDFLAWLSLMQHHGAPTRLLDFSHSFYIATYFALHRATKDSAVWAIDRHWLDSMAKSALGIELTGLRDEWEDSIYAATNQFLATQLATASRPEEDAPLGVVPVEPFRLHRRLSSQQGLFLASLSLEADFIENLEAHGPSEFEPGVRKVIFSSKLKDEGLAHLRSMNITEETLFPGLDGMTRSIMDQWLLD